MGTGEWEHRGVRGVGQPPIVMGMYSGPVIVLGNGRSVWDDWSKVRGWSNVLIAVNDVGMYINQHVKHWVSLHEHFLKLWCDLRTDHSLNKPQLHSHRNASWINHVWHVNNNGALSGYLAINAALAMGYDKVILCGCPADNSGRFFDAPWNNAGNHGDDHIKDAWYSCLHANPEVRVRVRSMSGWTRELLGEPTSEWMNG